MRQPLQARCAGSRQWLAVLAKHGTRFERINAADAATPTAQHLCARDHAATAARACGLTPSTWVGRVCAAHVHPLTALPHPCVARVSAHRRQIPCCHSWRLNYKRRLLRGHHGNAIPAAHNDGAACALCGRGRHRPGRSLRAWRGPLPAARNREYANQDQRDGWQAHQRVPGSGKGYSDAQSLKSNPNPNPCVEAKEADDRCGPKSSTTPSRLWRLHVRAKNQGA